ncbi:MAG: ABC transporter permease [Chloroflexi bacterium]|nr:ABC transporter permease [Chloroflexota bacterium]MCL5026941.1 ABC transporter permease [Chloroflexota bacterium]
MLVYAVRRLFWLPFLLLAVAFITFALGQYGPGDPVQVAMGQHVNPEVRDRVRHEMGLDRPFYEQFASYVWNALHGDLGVSYKYRGEPVFGLIGNRVAVSAQLAFLALLLAVALGIPLGIVASLHQRTWMDYLSISISLGGVSMPAFLLAPILMWFFAQQLKVLPAAGWGGIFSPQAVMPAIVMGVGPVAVLARQTRASLIEVLGQDYVRTARSKGLLEQTVLLHHVLRNGLIPIFTLIGLMLGSLVEGAFITETVFGIPGIGRLAVESLFARDYPVIMALTLMVAVSYTVANLMVDLSYGLLDPRIRYR